MTMTPLEDAEVERLRGTTGLELVKVVGVDDGKGRAYGHVGDPSDAYSGLYLIDLASGQVLEEITNPPWICPDCHRVHARVDPCDDKRLAR